MVEELIVASPRLRENLFFYNLPVAPTTPAVIPRAWVAGNHPGAEVPSLPSLGSGQALNQRRDSSRYPTGAFTAKILVQCHDVYENKMTYGGSVRFLENCIMLNIKEL